MSLEIQIALIASAFLILLALMTITKRVTKKVTAVKELEPNRKKVVLNSFYFLYYLFFIIAIIIIFGIDLKELSIFFSSLLAILGIALFAQWSLLSNLTASIILFFYHPLKIGDRIRILDKEFDFIGEVTDITGFYVMITTEKNQEITIPNSLVLQKGIEFLE